MKTSIIIFLFGIIFCLEPKIQITLDNKLMKKDLINKLNSSLSTIKMPNDNDTSQFIDFYSEPEFIINNVPLSEINEELNKYSFPSEVKAAIINHQEFYSKTINYPDYVEDYLVASSLNNGTEGTYVFFAVLRGQTKFEKKQQPTLIKKARKVCNRHYYCLLLCETCYNETYTLQVPYIEVENEKVINIARAKNLIEMKNKLSILLNEFMLK